MTNELNNTVIIIDGGQTVTYYSTSTSYVIPLSFRDLNKLMLTGTIDDTILQNNEIPTIGDVCPEQ